MCSEREHVRVCLKMRAYFVCFEYYVLCWLQSTSFCLSPDSIAFLFNSLSQIVNRQRRLASGLKRRLQVEQIQKYTLQKRGLLAALRRLLSDLVSAIFPSCQGACLEREGVACVPVCAIEDVIKSSIVPC